jgi:hypothetical protein
MFSLRKQSAICSAVVNYLFASEKRAMPKNSAKSSILYKQIVTHWIVLALVACGNSTPSQPAPALANPESFTQVGDFQLHYNALNTQVLSAAVAKQYGIQQSKHRGLVIVSVLKKYTKEPGFQPVAADVTISAHNLINQAVPVSLRRIDTGNTMSAVSYIGEVDVKHRQILFFEIKAIPVTTTQVLAAKFQHEFFVD